MNRLIATVLEVTNILTALGLIVGGIVIGSKLYSVNGDLLVGAIVGGVLGTVVAAGVCGIIAFLALIEKHLNFLASSLEWQNQITHTRIDPNL